MGDGGVHCERWEGEVGEVGGRVGEVGGWSGIGGRVQWWR